MRIARCLFAVVLLLVSSGIAVASVDPACNEDWQKEVAKLRKLTSDEMVRLREAAIAGDPEAQLAWGRTFGFAIEKAEDVVTARQWYTKAAEAGNCAAQKILAEWTMTGRGGAVDLSESYKWNLKLAERGVWTSQLNVGSMLLDGRGVDKDEKKGFEWFLRAANESDSATAQLALASAYMTGRGTEKDLDKAEAHARRASEEGLTVAEMLISSIQRMRSGAESRNIEAEKQLADRGDASAQFSLGMAYRTGRYVPQDLNLATKYLQMSAAQQFPMALWALGEMFEAGEGVTQDYGVAFLKYSAAADSGVRRAQYRLGLLYQKGLGTEANLMTAYYWVSIAARRGDKDAQVLKQDLEGQLSPEQTGVSQKLIMAFFADNPEQDKDMGEVQSIKWVTKTEEPEPKKQQ